jgi:hypothetical protein
MREKKPRKLRRVGRRARRRLYRNLVDCYVFPRQMQFLTATSITTETFDSGTFIQEAIVYRRPR